MSLYDKSQWLILCVGDTNLDYWMKIWDGITGWGDAKDISNSTFAFAHGEVLHSSISHEPLSFSMFGVILHGFCLLSDACDKQYPEIWVKPILPRLLRMPVIVQWPPVMSACAVRSIFNITYLFLSFSEKTLYFTPFHCCTCILFKCNIHLCSSLSVYRAPL